MIRLAEAKEAPSASGLGHGTASPWRPALTYTWSNSHASYQIQDLPFNNSSYLLQIMRYHMALLGRHGKNERTNELDTIGIVLPPISIRNVTARDWSLLVNHRRIFTKSCNIHIDFSRQICTTLRQCISRNQTDSKIPMMMYFYLQLAFYTFRMGFLYPWYRPPLFHSDLESKSHNDKNEWSLPAVKLAGTLLTLACKESPIGNFRAKPQAVMMERSR